MVLSRRLIFAATLLAFCVIALGAYVRLNDAGLGCPDWPGCYGHFIGVPDTPHEQQAAAQAFPRQPVETGKAWKEMIHRYFAGTLGLMILGIFALAWQRELRRQASPTLPSLLLGIVTLQAALGMWTVTLLLKPVIVTLHLLGGMTTLALLFTLGQRHLAPGQYGPPPAAAPALGLLALLAVIVQIALGGWVSSNYAALACPDFPLCQGQWLPETDFAKGFSLHRELGQTADGQLLPLEALTAIHWTHRLGALVVLLTTLPLAWSLMQSEDATWRRWGKILLGVVLAQAGMGIGNVVLSLPLPLAVAHNLGAAFLLTVTLAINLRMRTVGVTSANSRRPYLAANCCPQDS